MGTPVNVPVTLKATRVNDVGYDAVIAEVSTTRQPVSSAVTFYAVDSKGSPITQTNNGVWGPQAGFPLTKNYDQTSNFTVTFSNAGDYTVVVKLKDKATGNYIADETVNLTVGE